MKDLLDPLVEPFDDDPGDWPDVVARAGTHGSRLVRRSLVAAAFVLAALALTVPLGLAGHIVGLFHAEGKPVPFASLSPLDHDALVSMCRKVQLVTPRGKPPESRCSEGEPKIEEIARNDTRVYWKVTYRKQFACVASGPVHPRRDSFGRGRSQIGMMGCGPNVFPTPGRPITVDASMSFERGDNHARLGSLSGLAGDGISSVGLVAKDVEPLKKEVVGNTYDFGRPPNRLWSAVVAYDESGDEAYREPLHLTGFGFGRATRSPRPEAVTRPQPPPIPRSAPVQHAAQNGATVDVYRTGLVVVRLVSTPRRITDVLEPAGADRRVPISCSRLAYGAGQWQEIGSGSYGWFGREMRASTASPGGGASPPFDECHVAATDGRRWNDPRGMHYPLEFAFTRRAARYFAERAVAKDLSQFLHTPELRAIRKTMQSGERLPSGPELARRFPSRVVGLARRADSAPTGSIGLWTNGKDKLVVSSRADDGRRMFVSLVAGGRLGPHNLAGLTFVSY